MSVLDVPSRLENEFVNDSDITPSEINFSIEAVPVSGLSREDVHSDEILVNVINNINNLDSILIQEQSKVDWDDTVNLSSIYIPQNFLQEGISSSDIAHEEDEYENVPEYKCEVDDDTIMLTNSVTHNMHE